MLAEHERKGGTVLVLYGFQTGEITNGGTRSGHALREQLQLFRKHPATIQQR